MLSTVFVSSAWQKPFTVNWKRLGLANGAMTRGCPRRRPGASPVSIVVGSDTRVKLSADSSQCTLAARVAKLQKHDPFCAFCYTQPESAFFQRLTSAQAVDLASFLRAWKICCIDCHSGPRLFGRMQAELLGARNAVAWYTHTAIQPAGLTFPIQDVNCLKCHHDVTSEASFPNRR